MTIESTLRRQYETAKQLGWIAYFEEAAHDYNVPLEVLLAIASRETGIQNITGDHGHGRGIMQIDDRYHDEWLRLHSGGMHPATNIRKGASLLAGFLFHFHGDLQKAIAAYNAGIHGVEHAVLAGEHPDSVTTGGNYSTDVLERAAIFKKIHEEENA